MDELFHRHINWSEIFKNVLKFDEAKVKAPESVSLIYEFKML